MTPESRDLLGSIHIAGTGKVSRIADRLERSSDEVILSQISQSFLTSFRAAKSLAWRDTQSEFRGRGLQVPKLRDLDNSFPYGNAVIADAAANVSRARGRLAAGEDSDVVIRDLKMRLAAGITVGASRMYNHTRLNMFITIAARTQRSVLKEWEAVLDERTCRLCEGLHGTRAGLYDTFAPVAGQRVYFDLMMGPAHPLCRCSIKLVII